MAKGIPRPNLNVEPGHQGFTRTTTGKTAPTTPSGPPAPRTAPDEQATLQFFEEIAARYKVVAAERRAATAAAKEAASGPAGPDEASTARWARLVATERAQQRLDRKARIAALPDLAVRGFDHLKWEDDTSRIWMSRLTIADGATEDNKLTVERKTATGWEVYEPQAEDESLPYARNRRGEDLTI